MTDEFRQQITKEIVLTLITTGLFLLIWWLMEMPEWQRRHLMDALRAPLAPVRARLDMPTETAVRDLRRSISEWEHNASE